MFIKSFFPDIFFKPLLDVIEIKNGDRSLVYNDRERKKGKILYNNYISDIDIIQKRECISSYHIILNIIIV